MAAKRRSTVPGVRHEREHWQAGRVVAGVDEVGRGAWAGPVTVGAVVLPVESRILGLRDSKVLSPATREDLTRRIRRRAAAATGEASHDEIDSLGLSAALRLAATRAVESLPVAPEVLLIDGKWDFLADAGTQNHLLISGDSRSASIAAASIVAKTHRDAWMRTVEPEHPVYDFASNKGYPSPRHIAALDAHGPGVLHRRSWSPIAARLSPRLFAYDTVIG